MDLYIQELERPFDFPLREMKNTPVILYDEDTQTFHEAFTRGHKDELVQHFETHKSRLFTIKYDRYNLSLREIKRDRLNEIYFKK